VAECRTRDKLLKEVAAVYEWLDALVRREQTRAGQCRACGRCCALEQFGHRLFVTTPELVYLASKLGVSKLKAITAGVCPYNQARICGVYDYRFAGCRIFCCSAETKFQSTLSETALKKLKSICTEFELPYSYRELGDALSNFELT